jgi:regulatory protein
MPDNFQSLLNDAFRFLSFRPRSKQELTTYLVKRVKKKKVDPELASKVISRLEELDYVNDEKFAREWIESRLKGKGLGPTKLRQELKNKGIIKDIIDDLMKDNDLLDSESQYTAAKKVIAKRVLKWQKLPYLAFKRKIYEFLLRRGFSSALALKLVDEYCAKTYNTECENNN